MLHAVMDMLGAVPERTLMIGDTNARSANGAERRCRCGGRHYGAHCAKRPGEHATALLRRQFRRVVAWLKQTLDLCVAGLDWSAAAACASASTLHKDSYRRSSSLSRQSARLSEPLCARPVELDAQPGEFFDVAGLYLVCGTHGAAYVPKPDTALADRAKGCAWTKLAVENTTATFTCWTKGKRFMSEVEPNGEKENWERRSSRTGPFGLSMSSEVAHWGIFFKTLSFITCSHCFFIAFGCSADANRFRATISRSWN